MSRCWVSASWGDRARQRRPAGVTPHSRHQPGGGGRVRHDGAIIGDTIGYSIGHRYGMSLFERLSKRFPKHFGPGHVALAKQLFHRWGVWAVFFGRFIALLRILAGPLAGALKMRYLRFLPQRHRRPVLGRWHHRRRLLPRLGRRALAVAVFVDRARGRGGGRYRHDPAVPGTHRPRHRPFRGQARLESLRRH